MSRRHGLHAVHPRAWEKHHVLPVKGVRSPRSMARLLKWLSQEVNQSRRLQHLAFEMKSSPQMFSGQQVIQLAPYFKVNLIIALHFMDHHLLGVSCEQAATLIRLLIPPEQKLEALKILGEHLLDPANRDEIKSAFPPSPVLIQQVQTILDQVRGSSHVYGRIKAKSAIFLIDTSGSMHTEFSSECGSRFNRLEYVVHDLHKILHHRVPPEFRFNIFSFSSDLYKWKRTMQFASRANLKEAEHYLDTLEPEGGTNTHDALRAALAEPDVEVIYLLSDGEPTSGITSFDGIVSDVCKYNAMRATPAQIHTVAFLMGHHGDDPRPRRLMAAIAASTGGVFRCVDPHAPDHEDHGDFLDEDASFSDSAEFQQYFASRMAAIPQSIYDMCNKASLLADMPPPPNWKGNLISRQRSATEVLVSGIEAQKDRGHHIYNVDVALRDILPTRPICWTLAKTFNDFKRLHNKVKNLIDLNLTRLPPDPLFNNHSAEFLANRKTMLQTYIQNLYLNLGPFANSDLNEFLMYDDNVDEAIAEATDICQAHYLAQMEAEGKTSIRPVASNQNRPFVPSQGINSGNFMY